MAGKNVLPLFQTNSNQTRHVQGMKDKEVASSKERKSSFIIITVIYNLLCLHFSDNVTVTIPCKLCKYDNKNFMYKAL